MHRQPVNVTTAWLQRYQPCLYGSLALLAGTALPIQASMNAYLATTTGSVPLAAGISYAVGTAALLLLLATGLFAPPSWKALTHLPPWNFVGGLVGVSYIMSST
ncbi:hypothetical protein XM38_008400 [Halomicronema hongdechloris C2206]|uniref:Uncharacterized protein n=1 Tax=Halomicronema hongdechloris C2206 TaxID=1641165 RepID=A0A1Z3HI02_9CYAN|nr:DMT family transporter [Halomicronema hongdechloris]ASC69910.1 hypothetical protein XM38_008400 [Halomicronema hongdechloris C2206]